MLIDTQNQVEQVVSLHLKSYHNQSLNGNEFKMITYKGCIKDR